MTGLLILIVYIGMLSIVSFFASKKINDTPEGFFLAGRSLGPIVFFFSLTATNFSAFFFLGFAGAAYNTGLSQYGIMGIGTALVPVSFYFIGRKVWLIGKQKGYLTAPELIGGEFNSPLLRKLVLFVLVIFTIPYLLTQAAGAGIIISSLLGLDVLRIAGAITIMLVGSVIVVGGMRASAWTHVVQGVLMVVAMMAAVMFVARGLGGFTAANQLAYNSAPELFKLPGPGEASSLFLWLSFVILWTFVNPMFPQMFSRFYTAKSQRSLQITVWMYPLLVGMLFLAPVLIGVWARASQLEFAIPDSVLPSMVAHYSPTWVYILVLTGALAALMSTADAQLLAVASMLTNDLGFKNNQVFAGRWLTGGLCGVVAIFLLLGFNLQLPIFTFLTQTTFAGLAVLTPTAIAALYYPKIPKIAPIGSIIIGESIVLLMRIGWISPSGIADGMISFLAAAISLVLIAGIFPLVHRSSFIHKIH